MPGEKNLEILLKTIKPKLNPGQFVFCTVNNPSAVPVAEAVLIFKEEEGTTVVVHKETADALQLNYSFIAAWITLTVHSALDAVGLTAAFSNALSANNISCNVVAAYYHDHIFVDTKDAEKAMAVLNQLSA